MKLVFLGTLFLSLNLWGSKIADAIYSDNAARIDQELRNANFSLAAVRRDLLTGFWWSAGTNRDDSVLIFADHRRAVRALKREFEKDGGGGYRSARLAFSVVADQPKMRQEALGETNAGVLLPVAFRLAWRIQREDIARELYNVNNETAILALRHYTTRIGYPKKLFSFVVETLRYPISVQEADGILGIATDVSLARKHGWKIDPEFVKILASYGATSFCEAFLLQTTERDPNVELINLLYPLCKKTKTNGQMQTILEEGMTNAAKALSATGMTTLLGFGEPRDFEAIAKIAAIYDDDEVPNPVLKMLVERRWQNTDKDELPQFIAFVTDLAAKAADENATRNLTLLIRYGAQVERYDFESLRLRTDLPKLTAATCRVLFHAGAKMPTSLAKRAQIEDFVVTAKDPDFEWQVRLQTDIPMRNAATLPAIEAYRVFAEAFSVPRAVILSLMEFLLPRGIVRGLPPTRLQAIEMDKVLWRQTPKAERERTPQNPKPRRREKNSIAAEQEPMAQQSRPARKRVRVVGSP